MTVTFWCHRVSMVPYTRWKRNVVGIEAQRWSS
eukprot:CAMPEP_0119352400 /NCGR_PEP_ID=MMETSP1334-20130426/1662_1 /TAXON_ID=127549 /ORGANISM="Calcidiscus leptoporus, Strain RCC1130" /LENGTH=32 /DNA_ID= /DNA_START= /DNA_END= /DNA_ORIENTATION=